MRKEMKNIVIVFLILFSFIIAGCHKPAPPATLPYAKFSLPSDGKVIVEGIIVANRLNISDVNILPTHKLKIIENKIISGKRFDRLDMTLAELVSLLGPAYHLDESLQMYHWYFSNGKMLEMIGLYRLDDKTGSISIEKYDPKTFDRKMPPIDLSPVQIKLLGLEN